MKLRKPESQGMSGWPASVLAPGGLRGSPRGVALVLTLIMLAIITVVAVVFLATARRNRQSTSLRREQTAAENAAYDALHRATAEAVTRILRDTNLLSMEFFVSRPNAYVTNGLRPLDNDTIPEVTNRFGTIDSYLDWNRNREFDDPGHGLNRPFGDPIWLGILEKPWAGHFANNKFIARMAYVVLPAGKSLDLNTTHNAASSTTGYDFKRNQGFGPWELNLAAFLAELHPDVWYNTPNGNVSQYSYGPFPAPVAGGNAFIDARSIVAYRHDWGRETPLSISNVYPRSAFPVRRFPPPSIDAYSDGTIPGGSVLGDDPFLFDDDYPNKLGYFGWSGADGMNHWFHPQEFFHAGPTNDPEAKVSVEFGTNLLRAINGYTPDNIRADPVAFYRMLAQLGTDTGSDYHDRINLNYVAFGTNSASEFIPWSATSTWAVTFFTNVAQRIFLAQSNEFNTVTSSIPIRAITEIPVYPTNLYSTAIHRILQMAANIYDAINTNEYPSVFRPLFGPGPIAGVNYLVGFVNDDRASTLPAWLDDNTNGIPLVVGTKKGFPNFNELTFRSEILMTRKLQVTRSPGNPPAPGRFPNATNQMYVLGISNYFGVEAWNSYDYTKSGPFSKPVRVTVTNQATCWLSNDLGFQTNATYLVGNTTNLPANWLGGNRPQAFIVPVQTNFAFLSNAVYRFSNNRFENISTNDFEPSASLPTRFPLPYWVYTVSNRLSYLMSEGDRIIDFVLLNDNQQVDLFRELIGRNPYASVAGASTVVQGVWNTNRLFGPTGPTEGVRRQMDIALDNTPVSLTDWRAFSLAGNLMENDRQAAIQAFRRFIGLGATGTNTVSSNSVTEMQAGFNPAAKLVALSTWQANDPIVHYHPRDLRLGNTNNYQYLKPTIAATNIPPSSMGRLNERYSPWGGNPESSAQSQRGQFDPRVKDAGIFSPDDWNFPKGPIANVGLLGRVHRGTPWQSVYFKSDAAPLDPVLTGTAPTTGWLELSADEAVRTNNTRFSRTHPTNDWLLANMFTTGIDERTTRGFVSVNQTNRETWSALFGGVVVLSNSLASPDRFTPHQYTPLLIEPSGSQAPNVITNTALGKIWSAIHAYQMSRVDGLGRIMPIESIGDLLQIPELTMNSPYLHLDPPNDQFGLQTKYGLDDFAYEQIPQQILSLLRLGQPRFVVYAYGQALKPADIDPGTGTVRNYQVTAEFATRTVLRVEGDPRGKLRTVVESFNVLPPD